MKRHLIGICVFLSIIVFVTSCMEKDEIVHSDFVSIASENIIFGGGSIEDNIILTRSGETATHKTMVSKRVLISESDKDVSLPVIVEVQQGIHTSFAYEPKAAITADKESITELDAWCIYTDTDGARKLYFADMAEADRSKGAPFAKESDGIFYPKAGYGPYLWLKNSDNEFNFYNVTPTGSGFEANINLANNAVTFNYTVPQNAQDHKDILVASPAPVPGNFGQSVPLTFKHVMAAVNVKVGNQVPTGIIKSIKFTGVYNKASYFPDSNEWTNRTIENGGEFNVILPQTEGFPVVGEGDNKTPDKTPITTETTSFMMIPQQLFTGAEIVVDFLPDGRTEPLTLRASIQGDIWEMNTTTNYLINISDDYKITIVPLDKTLDSHYIITKVELSCEFPIWRLTATANDDADVSVVKEQDLNPMAQKGFWTDKISTQKDNNGNYILSEESARGSYITGGMQTTSQIVSVFIPENITGKTRTITLTLEGGNELNNLTSKKELQLTQNSVKWLQDPYGTGNIDTYWGCEIIIEHGQVPWGFFLQQYFSSVPGSG